MKFRIYRYDPEKDARPRLQDYDIALDPHDRMLLDALIRLKSIDDTLAFRRSCREGVCGSDAMNINGKNGLACITNLKTLKEPVELRPLPGLPVIRDLIVDTRELHYSTRNADHFTCYQVRGQETNVWCVAASVQMVLDFYRYEYTQVRLADELGLGTLANPSGLPYARDGDVVTVLEAMTSNALDASMTTSPNWSEFRTEIRANRPLISFVPGHSRTIAGYTRVGISGFGLLPFRGLLVYDPWPPNAGCVL